MIVVIGVNHGVALVEDKHPILTTEQILNIIPIKKFTVTDNLDNIDLSKPAPIVVKPVNQNAYTAPMKRSQFKVDKRFG